MRAWASRPPCGTGPAGSPSPTRPRSSGSPPSRACCTARSPPRTRRGAASIFESRRPDDDREGAGMSQGEASPDFGGELLSATVKRLVLDRIIQGHYRPGERIVEFKVAKELGLSPSPVREGVRGLAAVGIVTIHPRRGARVRLPSAKELADVSLVRAEIDALAARLAAGRIPDATLDALEPLIEEMLAALGRADFSGVTDADVRFHELIAAASENHAL